MRGRSAALVAATVLVAAGACSGTSTRSAGPCDRFGKVRDQLVITVGLARTLSRAAPQVPSRYSDGDRIHLCLLPTGTVEGVFLKDGRTSTLWEQSPDERLNSALPI
jgi:hypothetical protein